MTTDAYIGKELLSCGCRIELLQIKGKLYYNIKQLCTNHNNEAVRMLFTEFINRDKYMVDRSRIFGEFLKRKEVNNKN